MSTIISIINLKSIFEIKIVNNNYKSFLKIKRNIAFLKFIIVFYKRNKLLNY